MSTQEDYKQLTLQKLPMFVAKVLAAKGTVRCHDVVTQPFACEYCIFDCRLYAYMNTETRYATALKYADEHEQEMLEVLL